MRKKVVAGNWKMSGSLAANQQLLAGLKQGLVAAAAEVIVFPPSVYLAQVSDSLTDSPIQWGAQTVSANEPGAYTGEIAASMLLDFGCTHTLVGHSERRSLYHEDNTVVALKFLQAKKHGLIPILCVGETLAEREAGLTEQVIFEQLEAVLNAAVGKTVLQNAMVAYEPVWAIGTGLSATPEQAQAVHVAIREHVAQVDATMAAALPILYGGSVKTSNAAALFAMPDIDGGLIGGASLQATEFVEIVQCIK